MTYAKSGSTSFADWHTDVECRVPMVRYNLRWLFVATVLVAGLAAQMGEAHRQRVGLQRLRQAGAKVVAEGGALHPLLDTRQSRRVTEIVLELGPWIDADGEPQLPDRDQCIRQIAFVAECTNLQKLELDGGPVNYNADDLAPLGRLTHLRELRLHVNRVDDLSAICRSSSLERLDLVSTQCCRFEFIGTMRRLTHLKLGLTGLCELGWVRECTNLVELELEHTSVDDVRVLASLRKLRYLNLRGTQVADVAPLASLEALESLNLEGTYVEELGDLSNLRGLSIVLPNGHTMTVGR